MKKHVRKLRKLKACKDAVIFVEGYASLAAAWQACERGDWLLWYAGKMCGKPESKSRKKLVLAACKCARLSLKYVPKDELRPLNALETAEKWAKGDKSITLQDVKNAANAAHTAAYAAAHAADAAYYAAYAAYYAVYADKTKTFKKCADIVREYYPRPPHKELL